MLYYTTLYYTKLYCTTLSLNILHYTLQSYNKCYTILCYTTLHYTMLLLLLTILTISDSLSENYNLTSLLPISFSYYYISLHFPSFTVSWTPGEICDPYIFKLVWTDEPTHQVFIPELTWPKYHTFLQWPATHLTHTSDLSLIHFPAMQTNDDVCIRFTHLCVKLHVGMEDNRTSSELSRTPTRFTYITCSSYKSTTLVFIWFAGEFLFLPHLFDLQLCPSYAQSQFLKNTNDKNRPRALITWSLQQKEAKIFPL